ncbi:MAG: hypothetical protein PHP32_06545 [Candidatus Izemoplasmatales bacterium]|nr:hypothetical protein [Candidatus Izemoplasmatales bacterium]
MIRTIQELYQIYHEYTDPLGKIHREVKNNRLFPLVKGLYETDSSTPGHYLSGYIYGPSYLSFEYALFFYGMIPERVYTYTNASFNKNRSKRYTNAFGVYTYRDVPKNAFPMGLQSHLENGYSFLIATPEKAICDRIYIAPTQTSMKAIQRLLFEDLRIDQDSFRRLNLLAMKDLCELYPSSNLKLLKKWLEKEGY